MYHHITQETIDMTTAIIKEGARGPNGMKAITTSVGLYGYPLEAPAKKLYPIEDSMRRRIPRWVNPVGGTHAHWKVISAINTNNITAGVAEGQLNPYIEILNTPKDAPYKSLSMSNQHTQEAQVMGRRFEDVPALTMLTALQSLMIQEDRYIIGGCWNSLDTAMQAATITLTDATGGSLTPGAVTVAISALTIQGFYGKASGNNGTADSRGETTAKSASLTITGTAVTATWTDVPGAMGYNVYVGGVFWGRTPANRVTITTVPTSTNVPNTADLTVDNLGYQGLLEQLVAPGSGAYYKSAEGATLTGDGAGGILEFDAMFSQIWDDWAGGPTMALCNSQEMTSIKRLTLGNSSANAARVIVSTGDKDDFKAGAAVSAYLNPFTGQFVELVNSRHMPPGRIMFIGETVPYPNSEVPNNCEVELQMDYFGVERPPSTRAQSVDVTCIGANKLYLPGICGVMTNISA